MEVGPDKLLWGSEAALAGDEAQRAAIGVKARALARPDAARLIVDEVLALAGAPGAVRPAGKRAMPAVDSNVQSLKRTARARMPLRSSPA